MTTWLNRSKWSRGLVTLGRSAAGMKQVLNSWCDLLSQELINSAIDQWSHSHRLLMVVRSPESRWTVTVSIFYQRRRYLVDYGGDDLHLKSEIILWRLLVADLFLSSSALRKVADIHVLKYFTYQLLNTKLQSSNCPFSRTTDQFLNIILWWKMRESIIHGCKVMASKFCAISSGPSCI